jgi:transcriptional regulator of acetoin/glycerol metabolism
MRQILVRKFDSSPLALSDLPHSSLEELSQIPDTDKPPGADKSAQKLININAQLEECGHNLARFLGECERAVLRDALEVARGNQSQAAKLLGITPRTIYSKLRKHNLGV